jgi:UDP-N-acetylmuramate--alanine ligase
VREALPGYRICAVFQPHRYSRTKALMAEFATCFFDADYLLVTDIYAASEKPIEGIDAQTLVAAINSHAFKNARYLPEWGGLYNTVEELGREKLVVMTFGAGSITKLSHEAAKYFEGK